MHTTIQVKSNLFKIQKWPTHQVRCNFSRRTRWHMLKGHTMLFKGHSRSFKGHSTSFWPLNDLVWPFNMCHRVRREKLHCTLWVDHFCILNSLDFTWILVWILVFSHIMSFLGVRRLKSQNYAKCKNKSCFYSHLRHFKLMHGIFWTWSPPSTIMQNR